MFTIEDKIEGTQKQKLPLIATKLKTPFQFIKTNNSIIPTHTHKTKPLSIPYDYPQFHQTKLNEKIFSKYINQERKSPYHERRIESKAILDQWQQRGTLHL